MNIEKIAQVVHETIRAYCNAIGDPALAPWEEATTLQRATSIAAVQEFIANPNMTLEQQFVVWKNKLLADGWTYGSIKDKVSKLHPCLVDDYNSLPLSQRVKDTLVQNVIKSLIPMITDCGKI